MKINTDQNKKYGILLSGGLDSAILLSILLENNKGIDVQPFSIPKTDGSILYVNPIIDHLNKVNNVSLPYTIQVGNPDEHHSKQNISAAIEVFQKYDIDYLFIAINKIPAELSNYPGAPVRATHSTDSRILLPFVNLTKDEILSVMFLNGWSELAKITHSCTEQQTSRCTTCWQCTERKWAFDTINETDEGIF